ncbi:MAG: DUF134 domain-containing protein [Planctomycetes bacterium]|nr:DUF134 domain-containing protein [Planctomycetota bacterium]
MDRLEAVRLEMRELETLRCCNLERFDRSPAARCMGVSRSTVRRFPADVRLKPWPQNR